MTTTAKLGTIGDMQEPTLFTNIINGVIPAHVVYEDEQTFAFMDIHPVSPGHVLVISKAQVEFVWDLPPVQYDALMQTVRLVALRLRAIMGTPYVGEKIVGSDVPHAHVHVIPFYKSSELHASQDFSKEPDHASLAALAEKIRFS